MSDRKKVASKFVVTVKKKDVQTVKNTFERHERQLIENLEHQQETIKTPSNEPCSNAVHASSIIESAKPTDTTNLELSKQPEHLPNADPSVKTNQSVLTEPVKQPPVSKLIKPAPKIIVNSKVSLRNHKIVKMTDSENPDIAKNLINVSHIAGNANDTLQQTTTQQPTQPPTQAPIQSSKIVNTEVLNNIPKLVKKQINYTSTDDLTSSDSYSDKSDSSLTGSQTVITSGGIQIQKKKIMLDAPSHPPNQDTCYFQSCNVNDTANVNNDSLSVTAETSTEITRQHSISTEMPHPAILQECVALISACDPDKNLSKDQLIARLSHQRRLYFKTTEPTQLNQITIQAYDKVLSDLNSEWREQNIKAIDETRKKQDKLMVKIESGVFKQKIEFPDPKKERPKDDIEESVAISMNGKTFWQKNKPVTEPPRDKEKLFKTTRGNLKMPADLLKKLA